MPPTIQSQLSAQKRRSCSSRSLSERSSTSPTPSAVPPGRLAVIRHTGLACSSLPSSAARSSKGTSRWAASTPRSGFTAAICRAASSSPTMTATRAPLLSARFSCDLKLPPPQFVSTRSPGAPSRMRSARPRPTASAAAPAEHDVDVRTALVRNQPLQAHQLDDPFLTERPADRRHGVAAELAHESVVAAARADGILRAEVRRDPLEDGARIVIEAAHQARVEHEIDPRRRATAHTASRSARRTRDRGDP